jgi:hypothetical protein
MNSVMALTGTPWRIATRLWPISCSRMLPKNSSAVTSAVANASSPPQAGWSPWNTALRLDTSSSRITNQV